MKVVLLLAIVGLLAPAAQAQSRNNCTTICNASGQCTTRCGFGYSEEDWPQLNKAMLLEPKMEDVMEYPVMEYPVICPWGPRVGGTAGGVSTEPFVDDWPTIRVKP